DGSGVAHDLFGDLGVGRSALGCGHCNGSHGCSVVGWLGGLAGRALAARRTRWAWRALGLFLLLVAVGVAGDIIDLRRAGLLLPALLATATGLRRSVRVGTGRCRIRLGLRGLGCAAITTRLVAAAAIACLLAATTLAVAVTALAACVALATIIA